MSGTIGAVLLIQLPEWVAIPVLGAVFFTTAIIAARLFRKPA